MSKRQRFFVELIQDEITVISWEKLLADHAETGISETSSPAAPTTSNLNSPEDHALKSTGNVKRAIVSAEVAGRECDVVNALEDRSNMSSASRRKPKSNGKTITDTAVESDAEATIQTVTVPKGKVHRSMLTATIPGTRVKTSCRTKKKTKACFCCSKKEGTT